MRIPSDPRTGGVLPFGGALTFTSVGGITTTSAQIVNAALASGLPLITSFSPSGGGAGTVLVVTGANFTAVTDAQVGGVSVAGFVINSPTQMTLTLADSTPTSSVGSITLLGQFGSVNSVAVFAFNASLESDRQALEKALAVSGLTLADVSVEQTNNRITSIGTLGRALNTSLVGFAQATQTLTALRNLDLSNSGLTGEFPRDLARFTRLESLNLSGNALVGTLPTDVLCAYKNLRVLNVSRNRLEGEIPKCISTLDKVVVLNLSDNRFTGGLPKELGSMASLEELWVNNNRLTGALPPEFGTAEGAIPNAQSGGKVAAQAQSAQTLWLLDASGNALTGSIPAEWGGMRALKTVNLSNNRLTGALPTSVVNWEALETLRLGNNGFVGAVPALNTTFLKTLSLENNGFTGTLPSSLSRASRLRVLTADNNALTGLPVLLAAIRMDTIKVSGNRLEFGSLERNLGAQYFSYSPQDSIGRALDTVIRAGGRLVLQSGMSGKRTRYEWLRNGNIIPGATDSSYIIGIAQAFQSGVYICRASNDRLPDLQGVTRSLRVVVTGANQTLDAPTLLFPAVSGAENIAVRPRLVWSPVGGAEQYEVVLARDASLRQVVVRRVVTARASTADNPSYRLNADDAALERGGEYFWRVRALAAGSEGIGSATGRFRVVPLGIDIGFSTVDVGATLVGTSQIGDGVLVNVGTSIVTLDSAIAERTGAFVVLPGTQQVSLAPDGELPVRTRFAPQTAGETTASVRVWYKDGQQQQRDVSFANVLKGRGGALRVDDVEFEAVRVGRKALKTVRIINVSKSPVVMSGVSLAPINDGEVARLWQAAFSLEALPRDTVQAGDTLYVQVGCRSLDEADISAKVLTRWVVSGQTDSAESGIKAHVRFVNPDNPSVVLGVRPAQDSLAPGSLVRLEVFIAEGNIKDLFQASQPDIRLQVVFDPQVLSLVSGARQLQSRNSTESTVELATTWKETGVVATVNCRAVSGVREWSAVRLANVVWGNQGTERLRWEKGVVVEEPQDGKFTAKISKAGGKRLIGKATTTSIVLISPNPANSEVEISYLLADAGEVDITLVSMNGTVLEQIYAGKQASGAYTVRTVVRGMTSGSYRVLLRTQSGIESAVVNVVR